VTTSRRVILWLTASVVLYAGLNADVFGAGKRAPHLWLRALISERDASWQFDRWFLPGPLGIERAGADGEKLTEHERAEMVNHAVIRPEGVTKAGAPWATEEQTLKTKKLKANIRQPESGEELVSSSELLAPSPQHPAASPLSSSGSDSISAVSFSAFQLFEDSRIPRISNRSFLTRALGGVDPEWGAFNQLTPRLNFSHNLNRVFPAELYDSQPELFPLVDGERMKPGEGLVNWNPDLGEPAVAEVAADAAMKYFNENPDAVSFALGVNDGLRFGESPATLHWVEPLRWFRDRPDYSDLIFNFMNEVAERTSVHWPEKYVGALAYYWAENVPSFPLHPRVIPFLTADRSQFYDKAFKREELALQKKWSTSFGKAKTLKTKKLKTDGGREAPVNGEKLKVNGVGGREALVNGEKLKVNGVGGRGAPVSGVGGREALVKSKKLKVIGVGGREAPVIGEKLGGSGVGGRGAFGKLETGNLKPDGGRGAPVSGVDPSFQQLATSAQPLAPSNQQLVTSNQSLVTSNQQLATRLGLYDYIYGVGFLIPRIHTEYLAEHLRHARAAGFTDYYAEMSPNWGIDGPQPWLVAQLLMEPEADAEALLDEYYTRFFKGAARPMRRFFERCEEQWIEQAGPSYWLKHFKNDSQAAVFPSAVCRELRSLLDEAGQRAEHADDAVVLERIRFVSEAWGLTERYVVFCEARDALQRGLVGKYESGKVGRWGDGGLRVKKAREPIGKEGGRGQATPLQDALERYQEARAEFERYADWIQEEHPLAFSRMMLDVFLRHDPGPTAEALLAESQFEGQRSKVANEKNDPKGWKGDLLPGLEIAGLPFGLALPWGWQSAVEPWEGLRAEMRPRDAGILTQGRRDGKGTQGVGVVSRAGEVDSINAELPVLRLEHNKLTSLIKGFRVFPADWDQDPGRWGIAVDMRGKMSESAFLCLTLRPYDLNMQPLAPPTDTKFMANETEDWITLTQFLKIPTGTAYIGLTLWCAHQQPGDWLEIGEPRAARSAAREKLTN
jgi:hypothetical protein